MRLKRRPQWQTCNLSALLTTSGGGPAWRPRWRTGLGPSKSSMPGIWSPGMLMLCEMRAPRCRDVLGVDGERGSGDARALVLFEADMGDEKYSMSGWPQYTPEFFA